MVGWCSRPAGGAECTKEYVAALLIDELGVPLDGRPCSSWSCLRLFVVTEEYRYSSCETGCGTPVIPTGGS